MGNERDRKPERNEQTQWDGNEGSSNTKQQQQRDRPGGQGQQQQQGGNQRQPGVPHSGRDTEHSRDDRQGQMGDAEKRERDRDDR